MTIFKNAGSEFYLVKLSETTGFTHDAAKGRTSPFLAHPQSIVAHCNGVEWIEVAFAVELPESLRAAIASPPPPPPGETT